MTVTLLLHEFLFLGFTIEQCRIDQATNMEKLIKLLHDCQFCTRQRIWQHEMTGQGLQYGVVRFPTRVLVLRILSFLEITHYVWIKHDLTEILFVGDSKFFNKCVSVANSMTAGLADVDKIQITEWYNTQEWRRKECIFFFCALTLNFLFTTIVICICWRMKAPIRILQLMASMS